MTIFRTGFLSILVFILVGCAGTMPKNIGIKEDKLTPCPDKPNCVNSFSGDESHKITPLTFADQNQWQTLINILNTQSNSQIIINNPNYIHATFTSSLMGFVDDVEFYNFNNAIHVRSASRLGYSDLGANRDRIEHLRSQLNQKMK